MKKIILSLLLSLFITISFGQAITNQKDSRDYFLKKAKSQRTVAWILLGGGTACFFGGAAISLNVYGFSDKLHFWDYVWITGFAADIASIPFFLSAHHNKKRAARIAFTDQKVQRWPQKNSTGFITQPAFTIRINL
ncbi:MAG: hypothetical protein ABI594_17115 [Ginsengibacter sp.]